MGSMVNARGCATAKTIRNGLVLLGMTVAIFQYSSPANAGAFTVTNLVTDDQAFNTAQQTDTRLVNGWGIAASPTSSMWVGSNGGGVSTVYQINPVSGALTINPTTHPVIPGDGSVTGVAWSSLSAAGPSQAFNGDTFLFVSEDGTISGWRGAFGGAGPAEILKSPDPNNVYKGVTFLSAGGHGYLLSANFKSGAIDVFKGDAGAPNLPGTFTDPGLPSGYAPFNIAQLGGKIYITYAVQGAGKDELDGAGLGIVSVFDTNGNFLGRVGTGGTLNAPWGMAIAPTSFGFLAGDLLVGNFGDGTINVFNLGTNTFVEQLHDLSGNPIVIEGLWGLLVGSGAGNGGRNDSVYFAAGPNDEDHGLFGVINAVPEPTSLAMFGFGLLALGRFGRSRKAQRAQV